MSLFNTPQQQQQQQQQQRLHTHQQNFHGLFTHSKAEAVLQRMQKSIERHEMEITSLRCDVDTYQTQLQNELYTMNESLSSIQLQVENLSQRIQQIEHSIEIPGSPLTANVTVGEVIIANRRTIAKALNILTSKATVEDVKQSIQTEIQPMKDQLESWKKDLASNDAIQKSNETVSALIERVDILANDMCHKVDKTLFKSIASDATCIKNYAEFIRTTESITTKIENELESSIRPMIQSHDEKITSLEDQEKITVRTVQNQSQTLMNQYETLNKSLQSLMKDVEHKATITTLKDIEENQNQSDTHLSSLEEDIKTLYTAHETLAKYMTKRLDVVHIQLTKNEENNTKKKKEEEATRKNDKHTDRTKYYVQLKEYEEHSQKLKTILETKACKDSLTSIQRTIEHLENELSLTKRKADLSAQFVSWYGKQKQQQDDDHGTFSSTTLGHGRGNNNRTSIGSSSIDSDYDDNTGER